MQLRPRSVQQRLPTATICSTASKHSACATPAAPVCANGGTDPAAVRGAPSYLRFTATCTANPHIKDSDGVTASPTASSGETTAGVVIGEDLNANGIVDAGRIEPVRRIEPGLADSRKPRTYRESTARSPACPACASTATSCAAPNCGASNGGHARRRHQFSNADRMRLFRRHRTAALVRPVPPVTTLPEAERYNNALEAHVCTDGNIKPIIAVASQVNDFTLAMPAIRDANQQPEALYTTQEIDFAGNPIGVDLLSNDTLTENLSPPFRAVFGGLVRMGTVLLAQPGGCDQVVDSPPILDTILPPQAASGTCAPPQNFIVPNSQPLPSDVAERTQNRIAVTLSALGYDFRSARAGGNWLRARRSSRQADFPARSPCKARPSTFRRAQFGAAAPVDSGGGQDRGVLAALDRRQQDRQPDLAAGHVRRPVRSSPRCRSNTTVGSSSRGNKTPTVRASSRRSRNTARSTPSRPEESIASKNARNSLAMPALDCQIDCRASDDPGLGFDQRLSARPLRTPSLAAAASRFAPAPIESGFFAGH